MEEKVKVAWTSTKIAVVVSMIAGGVAGFLVAMFVALSIMAFGCHQAHAQTAEDYKNEIDVLIGYGPDGLVFQQQGQYLQVSPAMAPLAGLGYARLVDPRLSLRIEGFTGSSTQSRTWTIDGGMGYRF